MLAIRLIGEFEVELDGARAELPNSRRACVLLAWLAIHPGRHARSRLATLLWPDVLEAAARASLRSALWALRSALGPGFAHYLRTDRDSVQLCGPDLVVDLHEFDRLVSTGELTEAVAQCRGELLHMYDEDWIFDARDEHGARLATVLDKLGRRLTVETMPAIVGPPESAPRLVGRGAELHRLRAAWRSACQGSGSVSVIHGDGGIGKTRLVAELLAGSVRHAVGVAGGATPLSVWSDLLTDLSGAPRPMLRPAGDPSLERVRFFETVVAAIGQAARECPLLLVCEDMHVADPSSVELTGHVGRRVTALPVLLVLTRRDLPSRPDLDGVLAGLRSRAALRTEIELTGLTEPAVRELCRAEAELSDDAVDEIVALAAGSPLIAVELARARSRGDADLATGLRDATRSAIGRLGNRARLIVEFAAVAGGELTRLQVAALPIDEALRGVGEAIGSGLLRAHRGGVAFRHELLREAVYQDLPEHIRARLHEAYAEALRPTARGRFAAEIARHLRLGGRDDLAVGQLLRAAAHARTMTALPEAAGFLEEALRIEPDDPDTLVELAEVQGWRGLPAAADQAFDRAVELIPPLDSGALIGAWLRRGRWLRGGICHPRESRRSYRNALDVLDRDPAADPLARAEALCGLAWAEAVAGDPAVAEERLLEVGRLVGHRSAGDLLDHDIGVARGHALLRAGRFTDSYGPLIAASTAASRAGRPDMAYGCMINAASAAACAGDLGQALDFADRCLPMVAPNGLLRLAVYAQAGRAAILRRLGRIAEGFAACDAAAGLADRLGLPELEGLAHHERGLLALASGDSATGIAELRRALAVNAPVGRALARLCLAEALARHGQPDLAEAELRDVALEPVSASDFPDTLVARMAGVQGLIALQRGDRALAGRRLREAAEGWRRRVELPGSGDRYAAALIDLGRPPLSSLVEPARELSTVIHDLAGLE